MYGETIPRGAYFKFSKGKGCNVLYCMLVAVCLNVSDWPSAFMQSCRWVRVIVSLTGNLLCVAL